MANFASTGLTACAKGPGQFVAHDAAILHTPTLPTQAWVQRRGKTIVANPLTAFGALVTVLVAVQLLDVISASTANR